MNVLTKALRSDWNEIGRAAGNARADEFEQYVRAVLFPRESYDLLLKINEPGISRERYSSSLKSPDYKYVSKNSGLEFFIDVRFRSRFQDQILEWGKFFELNHYQVLDNITPVIIAIGMGGRPSAPERIFLVPVRHLKFVKQYPSVIQKYELEPGRSADDDFLRRILE